MLNYIFYTLYKYNLKDGKRYARINGNIIVVVTLFIYIGFIIVGIKNFAPSLFKKIPFDLLTKNIIGIIFILISCFIYIYYNDKRIDKLISRKGNIPQNPSYGLDVVFVILLIFVPLTALIIFGWKK